MRQSAELVLPLSTTEARVLASRVIHTDDTPVEVLDASLPHARTGSSGVCGDVRHPYVVYDYTPAGSAMDGGVPSRLCRLSPGAAAHFGGLGRHFHPGGGQIIEVAVGDARRKFFEAKETASRAGRRLARIGQLYSSKRMTELCAGTGALTTRACCPNCRRSDTPAKLTLRTWR